jgi:hypothetical protein
LQQNWLIKLDVGRSKLILEPKLARTRYRNVSVMAKLMRKLFDVAIEHGFASIELGAIESRSPSMATKTLAQAMSEFGFKRHGEAKLWDRFFGPHLFSSDAVALRDVHRGPRS